MGGAGNTRRHVRRILKGQGNGLRSHKRRYSPKGDRCPVLRFNNAALLIRLGQRVEEHRWSCWKYNHETVPTSHCATFSSVVHRNQFKGGITLQGDQDLPAFTHKSPGSFRLRACAVYLCSDIRITSWELTQIAQDRIEPLFAKLFLCEVSQFSPGSGPPLVLIFAVRLLDIRWFSDMPIKTYDRSTHCNQRSR